MQLPSLVKSLLTSWLKLTSLLFLLIGIHSWLGAQVEVNVKLRTTDQGLVQLIQQANGIQNFNLSQTSNLDPQYSFLKKLSRVEGLQQINSQKFLTNTPTALLFTLYFEEEASANALISQMERSGAFEFVEENRVMQLHYDPQEIIPSDDSLSEQWYHRFIESFQAWEYTKGDPNIKIGVIDTGLDYEHPEFQGQYLVNRLEDANGNGTFEPWPTTETRMGRSGDFDGIDNDNNGLIDDVSGYDFTDQPRNPVGGDYLFADPDPTDDNNHGTMVSGVIFAKHDNGFGGAGLAPNCKLLPIRAFGPSGAGEDDDIARSIIYAADQGVQILNFSFGDIYPSLIVHEAIKYAYEKGGCNGKFRGQWKRR